jgi:SAM-dependent methyltransferase
MHGPVTQVSCYLCGSGDCRQIHDRIRYDLPPRPYRCGQCGLVFLHPRMDPDEEAKFYREVYRTRYADEPAQDSFDASLPEARERVERFRGLLGKDLDILEIGCATGAFLSLAAGWVRSVKGVEITPQYAAFAKGLGVPVVTSLEEVPDGGFDRIFLFHVLEHLQDPIASLHALRSKIRPGGKLILEVPNVDDVLVSVYRIREHLDFYWEIAHQYYFSRNTLGVVLSRAGYHHEILPHQRYDLSNHIYWMIYKKPGGKGYFSGIFPVELEREYAKCLKDRFLSDTLYAVAEPGG